MVTKANSTPDASKSIQFCLTRHTGTNGYLLALLTLKILHLAYIYARPEVVKHGELSMRVMHYKFISDNSVSVQLTEFLKAKRCFSSTTIINSLNFTCHQSCTQWQLNNEIVWSVRRTNSKLKLECALRITYMLKCKTLKPGAVRRCVLLQSVTMQ